jgi:hypothetical protein
MSFSDLFSNNKRAQRNAAVIFDREEPIGRATDLVMPRRRWFRRKEKTTAAQPSPPNDQ